MKNPQFLLSTLLGLLTVISATLHAATETWDGGGSDGNWTTAENWSGDAVPGNSADVYTINQAHFSGAVTNGWGESVDNAIRIDSARSIDFVYFYGASGDYFLGSPDDSVLTLYGNTGGGFHILGNLTSTSMVATVQAPLQIHSSRTGTNFKNLSAGGSGAGSGTLVINGSLAPQTTSAFTLTLNGSNTNNNLVGIDLSDGVTSSLSINKGEDGKWVLAGDNDFTGTVTIGRGELSVGSLNSVSGGSATSNLGAPTTVADGTITMGSTNRSGSLRYTGEGETSDRVIDLAGTTGGASIHQAGTGTLTLTSSLTATGAGSKTLFLGGSTDATGRLEGAIVDNSGTNKTSIRTYGAGAWELSGNNTNTGNTTLGGGTLRLDYGTNNTSKLSDSGVLTLSGGTLELSGGSHAEAVGSTRLNSSTNAGSGGYGAMTTITRSSGNSSIALGAVTSTNNRGVLNVVGGNGVATTTNSNNAAGILAAQANDSAFVISVNGTDFATNDGSNNIVAYSSYTALTAGASTADTTYSLTGNLTRTGHFYAGGNRYLKIDTDGVGQSLNLGNWQFFPSATIFDGDDDYTITSDHGFGGALLNYGAGNLTIDKLGGYTFYQYGTGTTILTGTSTGNENMGLYVGGGVLELGNVSALGNSTGTQTGVLDGGTLRGDTSGGDITMQYGANVRNFVIGDNNGRFDVVGGGNLTISGTVSSNRGLTIIGSNATSGTVVFSGSNTHAGGTRLDGGTWRLDNLNASGTGEILFNGGTLAHGSGIANDLSGQFAQSAGQTFKIDTNGNDVTYRVGMNSVGGNLTKLGAGTLTLGGASTYNGTTTVSAGTLALLGSNRLADASSLVVDGGEFALGTANETVSSVTLTSGTISGSTGVLQSSGGFILQSGTVSARFGGSSGISKQTAGTVHLAAESTFTGTTVVASGTLTASATNALGATSAIQIDEGAVLGVAASDALNSSAGISLAQNARMVLDSGAGSNSAGVLTLQDNAVLDLGSSAGVRSIAFAASSAATWSGTLSVWNWDGTPGVSSGNRTVSFGSDSSGLTSTQLQQIRFYSDSGSSLVGDAEFGTGGEILAVPEPGTWALLGAGFLLLAATRLRKRLLRRP